MRPYKFTLVSENSLREGYFTEKLVGALLANTLPVYCGGPDVFKFVNPKRFIWCNLTTEEQDFMTIRYFDSKLIKNIKEDLKIDTREWETLDSKLGQHNKTEVKGKIDEKYILPLSQKRPIVKALQRIVANIIRVDKGNGGQGNVDSLYDSKMQEPVFTDAQKVVFFLEQGEPVPADRFSKLKSTTAVLTKASSSNERTKIQTPRLDLPLYARAFRDVLRLHESHLLEEGGYVL